MTKNDRARPNRHSLYPDWSTLVYAFEGTNLQSAPEKRELLGLVHQAADGANLCLSFAHLLELLLGADAAERRLRAQWLDSLRVVWLHDLDAVRQLELDRFLRKSAGHPVGPLKIPAAPSFLSTFPLTVAALPEVLRQGDVASVERHLGDDERIRRRIDKLRALGPTFYQRLFADRKLTQRNLSEDELRTALKAKLDGAVKGEALVRNQQLATRDPTYCIRKGILWVPPDDEFVTSVMRPLDEIRNDLPSVFVFFQAIWNAGSIAGRKEHVSTKFFKSSDRESDVFDWWHLLGAAYCDVFICDAYTSTCLGDARARLGRSKEIVYRSGDVGRLIQDIRAALSVDL